MKILANSNSTSEYPKNTKLPFGGFFSLKKLLKCKIFKLGLTSMAKATKAKQTN